MKKFSFETKDYWVGPEYRKFRATEEQIRENQRKNRLQREMEERAYAAQNKNSEPSNEQDTQEKDES